MLAFSPAGIPIIVIGMANAYDLDGSLAVLGWSKAELARRLRVHPNTVSYWGKDGKEVPGPVRAYLDLAVKVRSLLE